jgi:dihydroorotase
MRGCIFAASAAPPVSDHTPVDEDAKTLPFAEAEPGATGLELLLSLALKWGYQQQSEGNDGLMRTLQVLTSAPANVLGASLGSLGSSAGQLVKGGVADVCVFDAAAGWTPEPSVLRSQGKNTPFSNHHLPGKVRYTLVGGHVAFDASA